MSTRLAIVLLHGWAMPAAVWREFIEYLQSRAPTAQIIALDLPGYGEYVSEEAPNDLAQLAQKCLDRAPEKAIWVGWSLGGMIAMQAALQRPDRVLGLQLINTTPKFRRSDDWPNGTSLASINKIRRDFGRDYHVAFRSFLLLQAGHNVQARAVARRLATELDSKLLPTLATLESGLHCLIRADLRARISELRMPIELVCGLFDRVINAKCSMQLAQLLQARLMRLPCGHVAFLTHKHEIAERLASLYRSVELTRHDHADLCT